MKAKDTLQEREKETENEAARQKQKDRKRQLCERCNAVRQLQCNCLKGQTTLVEKTHRLLCFSEPAFQESPCLLPC